MEVRKKPLILFVAEAVTLSHFARVVSLAKSLDPSVYDIVVASDPRYLNLEKSFPFMFYPIRSIPSSHFFRALAQGKPVYDTKALIRYIEEDQALLDEVKPDLVVGDFRLSLSVSAPLQRVPYAAVVNAYWSPFADTHYPIPELPITKFLGVNLAQKLFDTIRPLIFALHATPLNKVRRRYGLTSLGHDLRNVYTWADFTLYADVPEAVPTVRKPVNHWYLGPVLWSTKTPLPEWWHDLPEDKPVAFVTLGSSGRVDLLPLVLRALSVVPLTVIATTAGKIHPTCLPSSVFIADYLPIDLATQRSNLVVSNGGSLTTYQALSAGKPVIGIAANMDQLLNMYAVERLGAGITVRASRASFNKIQKVASSMLDNPSCTQAACRTAEVLKRYNSAQQFREIVAGIIR